MTCKRTFSIAALAPACVVAAALATAAPASAASPALYWTIQKVKTSQFGTCLSFAHKTLHDVGLTDLRKSNVDVAGRTANTHSFITCVNTTGGMKAFIVCAGAGEECKQLRAKMADKIGKIVLID